MVEVMMMMMMMMKWNDWNEVSVKETDKWDIDEIKQETDSRDDRKQNEPLVIFKEEDADGDGGEMVTAEEERVLRGGWTDISLQR